MNREDFKYCPKCDKHKPLTHFHKNKRTKDSHTAACKDCNNAYSRRWREQNPTYQRVWVKAHPNYFQKYHAARKKQKQNGAK